MPSEYPSVEEKKEENENNTQKSIIATSKTINTTQPRPHPSTGFINSIPVLCLSSALKDKAPLSHLSSWMALSLTLNGRDKITKVIQYSCRLLTWWYSSSSTYRNEQKAASYSALYKNLVQSRKAFRLGRTIPELHKLKKNPCIQELARPFKSAKTNQKPQSDENPSNINDSPPWWRNPCAAIKLLGLAGFWFGDNVTYLTSIGFFDTYFQPPFKSTPGSLKVDLEKEKLRITSVRNNTKTIAQQFAARSYFIASIVGLYANLREVLLARQKLRQILIKLNLVIANMIHGTIQELDDYKLKDEANNQDVIKIRDEWEKEKSKYFLHVVALTKSVCDTIVFSNNAGIDWHLKLRGRKNHEGLHCLCGIISASTVLYNSVPKKKISV